MLHSAFWNLCLGVITWFIEKVVVHTGIAGLKAMGLLSMSTSWTGNPNTAHIPLFRQHLQSLRAGALEKGGKGRGYFWK